MRKFCQSALQSRCPHSGTPFHAGRALFSALQARNFAASPRCRDQEDKKGNTKPAIRWFEQTSTNRDSIKPFDENGSGTSLDKEGFDAEDQELEELEKQLAQFDRDGAMEEAVGDEDGEESLETTEEGEEDPDDVEDRFAQELQELEDELRSLELLEDDPGGEALADGTESDEAEATTRSEYDLDEDSEMDDDLDGLEDDFASIEKDLVALENVSHKEKMEDKTSEDQLKEDEAATSLISANEGGTLSTESLELEFKMPSVIKARIKGFNEALKNVASHPTHVHFRRVLWLTFERCKRTVPGFLDQIPELAWQVLWQSQSAEPFFDEQPRHLLILTESMRSVKKSLTPAQKILCIKAYEADGRAEEALNMWNKERKQLQKDREHRFEFSALGVTLECLSRQPARAEAIALDSITREGKSSGAARLFLPIIEAWAKHGTEESLKRAWGLYLYAKQLLTQQTNSEHRMTAEDHDQIFLGFLDAGRKDLALMVFKDLILAGQKSIYDSASLFKSMGMGLEKIHSNLNSAEELNKISLEALFVLPKRFENKYFYASWMKRLIGMGRVDAAATVMELMYERGIAPDAKHINGIVGCWLRQGSQEQQDQALDLAWSMVDERLKIVESRYHAKGQESEAQEAALSQTKLPKHLNRQVPRATTETFCLLLMYYANKNLTLQVDKTQELLAHAELSPNSYFMNHLMFSYSTRGKPAQAWEVFNTMSKKTQPDMASFQTLWRIADRLTSVYEQMDRFPSPRRLFSTMMNWYSQLNDKGRAEALQYFDSETYSLIARAFCKWKDLNGTLVAMYALRDTFGFYPDEPAMRLVSIQIASMGSRRQAPHPTGRMRMRRRATAFGSLTKNIESAERALRMLFENRAALLAQEGLSMEDLTETQRGEERLYLLAELLRAAQRESLKGEGIVETQELSEEFDQVAWDLGAGPFKTGAPVYDRDSRQAGHELPL